MQRATTEKEVRDKRRALLHEIYRKDPAYFHAVFDSSSGDHTFPRCIANICVHCR